MTRLQQAARCAVADLLGQDIKTIETDQTILELLAALKEEGVDVSDYDTDRETVEERLADRSYD